MTIINTIYCILLDDFFISIPGINVIYGEYFISDHASFGSNFLFYGSDEYWSSNISGVVSYYPFGHTTSSFYGRAEIGSILSERGNDGTFWGIGLGRINETRYFVWRTEINYNHIIDWHVNKELSFVFALGKKF